MPQHPPIPQALRALLDAAIRRAHPAHALAPCLPPVPAGRTVVVGLGKAAADMAQVLEQLWQGPLTGLVVVPDGHEAPCQRIEVITARHPVPDERSATAAQRLMAAVTGLQPQDLVLALVSGGGSSLAVSPAPGITLQDKQRLNQALLACGAGIHEINTVRRQLSGFKGGHLAARAWPARVHTIALSDIPGDDLRDIASGPTLGSPDTIADARAVLRRHGLTVPPAVQALWQRHETGAPSASLAIHPQDPRLAGHTHALMATPLASLTAARALCLSWGVDCELLGDTWQGEAREAAAQQAELAAQRLAARQRDPAARPLVLLSGGELSVRLPAPGEPLGCGGRNVEFLLALGLALEGQPGVHALAADTDGIDGAAPVAGAWLAPHTLAQARAQGLDPAEYLRRHDAHAFFAAVQTQVVTGPTRTNVNDFRALWLPGGPTH